MELEKKLPTRTCVLIWLAFAALGWWGIVELAKLIF